MLADMLIGVTKLPKDVGRQFGEQCRSDRRFSIVKYNKVSVVHHLSPSLVG